MPYRSLLLVLVLLLCCNWVALGEEEQAKPAKLTAESFRFDPAEKGLSIGIHLDEENGYLYALVKNVGPDEVTINTLTIDNWEFWNLQIKHDKEWLSVPFADTANKARVGVATAAKARKTLRSGDAVTKNPLFPNISVSEKNHVLIAHEIDALPNRRKANRNDPQTGATAAFDLLDFKWPSDFDNGEITIRMKGAIFIDDDNSDDNGYKQKRTASPEIKMSVAALRNLLQPDFSIRLAQNKEAPGIIDVYLRNITAKPIEFFGRYTSAPWKADVWFNIEVNGKQAEYSINVAGVDNPSRKVFKPNEESLFTQIDITWLRFIGELDGRPALLRAAPKNEVSTIVLSGAIIQAPPSEPLEVKPTE